jgi:hypothetical protein
MIIRRPVPRALGIDEPLRHESHKRPVTRRDFLAQGFVTGAATVIAPGLLGMLANPRMAHALSDDITAMKGPAFCDIKLGAGKVPFICFDLAGGANIAGSNVLVGQGNSQMNFLSTAGYSKLGIPGNQAPGTSVAGAFVDTTLGLAFHSDSAFLRGMMTKISAGTAAKINGVVIPARSENDTGNNPHNPMYGIAKTGAQGSLLALIGSQNSDSGGNSMAPMMMIDPTKRPTKIDRTSDAVGLVNTGKLSTMFTGPTGLKDTVSTMESISRLTEFKLANVTTKMAGGTGVGTPDFEQEKLVQCAYVKTADTAENFASSDVVNPQSTADVLVGPASPAAIFTTAEYVGNGEYDKAGSVAKLVVNGYAGAGSITMGGFDYHTGNRSTGEQRDFRAGVCMGACLEYAARKGKPLMLYCFSDGSLNSNGMIDSSVDGRGKGVWTGDNQGTACSFFLVYSPNGRPQLTPAVPGNQIGSFTAAGDVATASSPAANAVNLLVETIILNYMALHGEQGNFQTLFPNTGLSTAQISNLTAFSKIT